MNNHEIMTALECLVNLAEGNCLDNEIDVDDEMEDETLVEDAKYQRDSINTIKDFIALWADNKVKLETIIVPDTSDFDITKENYDPVRCPHCGSLEITAYDNDFDIGWANSHIKCEECETTWTEYYEFVGVHSLEIGD